MPILVSSGTYSMSTDLKMLKNCLQYLSIHNTWAMLFSSDISITFGLHCFSKLSKHTHTHTAAIQTQSQLPPEWLNRPTMLSHIQQVAQLPQCTEIYTCLGPR